MSEESINYLADLIRKVHARKQKETRDVLLVMAAGFMLLFSFIVSVYFVIFHAL